MSDERCGQDGPWVHNETTYRCELARGHEGLHAATTAFEPRPRVTWCPWGEGFRPLWTKLEVAVHNTAARALLYDLISAGFGHGCWVSEDGQALVVSGGPTEAAVEKAVQEVRRTRVYRRYKDVPIEGVRVDGTCM